MRIRIFQIDLKREKTRVKFLGLQEMKELAHRDTVDRSIYRLAFDGEVNTASLEDVFQRFNMDGVAAKCRMHSLSVSDVVEVVENKKVQPGYYYCDNFGWAKIEFDPPFTLENEGDWIDKTIFAIEEQDGEKVVHFYGYGYYAEDSATNDPNETYRFVEYTFCYAPLKAIIEHGFAAIESEESESCKQYITDCTAQKCLDTYLYYDDGATPKTIAESDLSLDTPCGTYMLA